MGLRGVSVALAAGLALLSAAPADAAPLRRAGWLRGVLVTEYYPAPESWFVGRRVTAPGIPGKHRVDWLYSARGMSMEGDGVGLDGRRYHIAGIGRQGWVNRAGRRTRPGPGGHWSAGSPYWRAVGWRNARGGVTFPVDLPGSEEVWSNGRGRRHVAPVGISFGRGPSRPIREWRTAAVDPALIPMGSRIFIPAYCGTPARGWLVAADTGSAVQRKHIDVFRRAPATPDDRGRYLPGQDVWVLPKGARRPSRMPSCATVSGLAARVASPAP